MPVTDDQIREKYLERAIREMNALGDDVRGCTHCVRGDHAAVLGSGHPQADVFLLKHGATPDEVQSGAAFVGPSGEAVLKSVRALGVDPTELYGTVAVKCHDVETGGEATPHPLCVDRVGQELAIVQPRIVVAMGEAAVDVLNGLAVPMADHVAWRPGVVQRLTPLQDVLVTPDIDASLHEDDAKQAFWAAFRALGPWYEAHAAA